jgi:hypothetical protein
VSDLRRRRKKLGDWKFNARIKEQMQAKIL